MTIYLSLLVNILGLGLYLLSPDAQVRNMEVGRLAFFGGLLAFLLLYTKCWVL